MKKTESVLEKSIEEVEMPTALRNALKDNGITKVSQIIALNKFEVKMLKNFGAKRIEFLDAFLSENNLSLKGF